MEAISVKSEPTTIYELDLSDLKQTEFDNKVYDDLEVNENLTKQEEIDIGPSEIFNQPLTMGTVQEFHVFSCDCCADNFVDIIKLFEHRKTCSLFVSNNQSNKSFRTTCFSCPLQFDFIFSNDGDLRIKKDLAILNLKVIGIKPFQKLFKTTALPYHKNIHGGKKPYTCNICNKKFTKRGYFRYHQYIHMDSTKFNCNICNKKYSSSTTLKRHSKLHVNGAIDLPQYKCDFCNKIYLQKKTFKYHVMEHTGEDLELNRNKFKCNICNKIYSQKKTLEYHIMQHTGEGLLECTICKKKFTNPNHLKKHYDKHSEELNKNKFKCNSCLKTYDKEILLKNHKCTSIERFKCDLCPRSFLRKHKLEYHKNGHYGRKPYACQLCDKKFTMPDSLKEHQATHIKRKQFTCNICNKKYSTIAGLNCHSKSHVEQFKCNVCGKRYLYKETLANHMKRHTRIEESASECNITSNNSILLNLLRK